MIIGYYIPSPLGITPSLNFFFHCTPFISLSFNCFYNNHQENIHLVAIFMQQLSYSQELSTPHCNLVLKNKYEILIQYLSLWLFFYFTRLPWARIQLTIIFDISFLILDIIPHNFFSTYLFKFPLPCHTHPFKLMHPILY